MKNAGFSTPNIWVITPKNEGCGFPWYFLTAMNHRDTSHSPVTSTYQSSHGVNAARLILSDVKLSSSHVRLTSRRRLSVTSRGALTHKSLTIEQVGGSLDEEVL